MKLHINDSVRVRLTQQGKEYLKNHEMKKKSLEQAICRIQKKKTIVTSEHLKNRGIPPGPDMGKLLKEAERIAINENLQDAETILNRLLHK